MGQFHSISHSGMAIFDRPISSTIGGIVVDLASAPINPGEHKLEIDAAIGGVEIYLPRYVKFVVEGGAAIGGQDVHDGLGFFGGIGHRLAHLFRLSNQVPLQAVENPHPDQPITIHLVIDGGIGGLDIYRI
jgi:hypothetical protein